MLFTVVFKVPAPPVHDQPALLDEFCFLKIGGAYVVALLVAYLPFNRSSDHNSDLVILLQAFERNSRPQISVLVSYSIVRSSLFIVFFERAP